MNKILLLGGTGAMGVYLQETLIRAGNKVYVTSRHSRESFSPLLKYIVGNARNDSFLEKVIQETRPDAIVDFMVYSTARFLDRMEMLLSGTRHYLFLSSYRVYAENIPLVESSPRLLDVSDDPDYLETDEYALLKARQENLLRLSKSRNWTILRPSITFSKERFQFGCLEANVVCYRAFKGRTVVIPEEMMDKQATLTWAKDVAMLISKLILNPESYGEDFNVVTSEHHTWREIADIYSKVIGLKVQTCSLDQYLSIVPSRPQVMLDRMFHRIMDNSKVLSVSKTNAGAFSSLEDSLRDELLLFEEHPRYSEMDIPCNARMDRVVGGITTFGTFHDNLRYFIERFTIIGLMVKFLTRSIDSVASRRR